MLPRIALLIPFSLAITMGVAACKPQQPAQNASEQSANAVNETLAGTGVPTGGVCGGIGGLQCASDKDFCKKPAGQCQTADAQGICTTRPQICPKNHEPVCGCDGKTYGNACEADAAGVSVDAPGECHPKG